MVDEDDIHFGSDEQPILTKYEPNFRRFYARGGLAVFDDEEPDILRIGFWSSKNEDIPLDEEETTGTGYHLEAEAALTWQAAKRLHMLLDRYIEEYGPEDE